MTTLDDLIRAGLLLHGEADAAAPILASWDEDSAAEVANWTGDYILWTTDFVSWSLGPVPSALRSLLRSLNASDRITGKP